MKIPKPTLAAIWLVLPVLLTLLIVWTNNEFPLDFWLHVKSGRWMCETPPADCGRHVHAHDRRAAGAQPALAGAAADVPAFQSGGYPLTQFVLGGAYGVAIGLITLLTYRRCADGRVTAAVMIAAVAVASTNLAIRPQAFSVLLFAAELYALSTWGSAPLHALDRGRHRAPLDQRARGISPGSRPAGDLSGRRDRADACSARDLQRSEPRAGRAELFLLLRLASIAMFVNPQGLATMRYVSGVASRATERHIEEWLPTSMDSAAGTAFMLSVAARCWCSASAAAECL